MSPCYNPASIAGLGIGDDINSAFNRWNYANQSQNSSNVQFFFSTTGAFEVEAYTPTFAEFCGYGEPAHTAVIIYAETTVVVWAKTRFFFGTDSNTVPSYPNWDPLAGNFHTAVQKIMAHEIGHPMGLDNQPVDPGNPNCGGQTAGESVMNAMCGTNDSANNLPTPTMLGIPSCDNASVR